MKKTHKRQETRQKLIDAAGRSFRSHGFSGVGVDAIAKSAGATSGAFYAHLNSKSDAFLVALESGLNEVIQAVPAYQSEHGVDWIDAFIDYYLGKPHRDDLACGCAMTTLSPDVMRGDERVRSLYQQSMSKIARLIAEGLPGADIKSREMRAWAFLQVLIGGLIMSRSMLNTEASNSVAEAAKVSALAIAKTP